MNTRKITIDTDSLTLIAAGPMGSGKTHLLRRIEATLASEYTFEFHATDPDRVVVKRK